MEFYFKTIGAKVHLYRTGSFFDEDLGELTQTFTGKLRTNKLFSENFEIEDISGPFSKGQRYRITSTEGLSGVLEKKMWGDRYTFSQSHPNNGSISIPKYQPTTNSGHTPTIEPVHNKNMNFWFGFLLFVVIGGLTAGIITSMDNSEQEQGQDLVSVMELLTMEGHPVYYGDVHEAERFWKGHDQVKVVGIRQAPHNEGALLLMAGDLNHKAITNITINLSSVENKQDIQLEDVLQLVCDYIPYDIINDYYTFEESFHEISNRSQYEAYHYAMKLNEDGMAVNRSGERDLLEKFTFKIIHRNTDDWIVEMKFLWHQGNHTRSAQGAYEVKDWDVDIYKYKAADSLS